MLINASNKVPLFLWFDHFLNFWAEILAFLENFRHLDIILKLPELYKNRWFWFDFRMNGEQRKFVFKIFWPLAGRQNSLLVFNINRFHWPKMHQEGVYHNFTMQFLHNIYWWLHYVSESKFPNVLTKEQSGRMQWVF